LCTFAKASQGRISGGGHYGEGELKRFINLFLVGYFVLILGLALALWQSGVLGQIEPIWIGIGALVAIGFGIMLSVSSGKPDLSEEIVKR